MFLATGQSCILKWQGWGLIRDLLWDLQFEAIKYFGNSLGIYKLTHWLRPKVYLIFYFFFNYLIWTVNGHCSGKHAKQCLPTFICLLVDSEQVYQINETLFICDFASMIDLQNKSCACACSLIINLMKI